MGGPYVVRFTTSTHDEYGQLTKIPAKVERLNRRLAAKIEAFSTEINLVKADLQAGAETLVISYGITAMAVQEAVAQARARGDTISYLILYSLWPVPEEPLAAAIQQHERVIVPELNLGQYRREIERMAKSGQEIIGVNRVDGGLISPVEILTAAQLECGDYDA
jgi:2-oxoglutarate ferredoxin oxidoreductase subunit alpha